MAKMDPHFRATFRREFPEEYKEALALSRKRDSREVDPDLAIKVDLLPQRLKGLLIFGAALAVIVGGYLAIAPHANGIPSGKVVGNTANGSQPKNEGVEGTIQQINEGVTQIADKSSVLWDNSKTFDWSPPR